MAETEDRSSKAEIEDGYLPDHNDTQQDVVERRNCSF